MRKNTKKDFWELVKISKKTECWHWMGSTFNKRYGRFSYGGKSRTTHRLAFEFTKGKIVEGMYVMHKCNNMICCNPSHLKLGTPLENTRHASSSGSFDAGQCKIRGVGFIKDRGYWHSQGWIKGKRFNLYTGPSKKKAIAARKQWENKYRVSFNLTKGK